MNPNRIVAVLTPLVFAPLAGAVASWLAEHFPGVDVSQNDLQAIFIAGALIALAPAVQWLHGWQKYEARQADLNHDLALANAVVPVEEVADEQLGDADDELEDLDDLAALDDEDFEDDFEDELLDDDEPVAAGS